MVLLCTDHRKQHTLSIRNGEYYHVQPWYCLTDIVHQVFAINPTATKNFTAFQTLAMTPNASLPAGQNPPGTVVTTEAALSAGPLSSQTSETPSPSGTPSPSSGGNGTTGSNGTTSSNTTSGSPPANTNAAMKMSGSSISLLTVAGLVAGLAL